MSKAALKTRLNLSRKLLRELRTSLYESEVVREEGRHRVPGALAKELRRYDDAEDAIASIMKLLA